MELQEQREKRLLFVTRKWPPAVGGMEIYSQEMAREFAKIRETTVLALEGQSNGQPPRISALIRFVLSSSWYLFRHSNRYDSVFLGDLVLAPLAVFCRLSSRKVRTAVALHGSDVAYHLRPGFRPKLYRCYLILIRCLRNCLDAVIANSKATAQQARHIGLPEIYTIPLGVHLPEPLRSVTIDRYILFVGRIMPRKGAAWFADNVLPGLPADIQLLVAGTNWDDAELSRLASNAKVKLLGPVFGKELQKLRANALVVVVPNIPLGGRDFEGFGLVALEAAADEGVVIAADLDGLSSAILDAKTGFLVAPEDSRAWREKILWVLEWTGEQRAAFIAGARACLTEDFSWEATAQKTIAAIEGADRGQNRV